MTKATVRNKSAQYADVPFIKVPRVIGIIVILIGFAQLAYFTNFSMRAERAEATITQSVFLPSIRNPGKHPGVIYSRGVRSGAELTLIFIDNNGVSHTAQIVRRGFDRDMLDEKVSILFLPETPENAIENTWLKTWGPGLIYMLAGLVFWKLSVRLIVFQHKNKLNNIRLY